MAMTATDPSDATRRIAQLEGELEQLRQRCEAMEDMIDDYQTFEQEAAVVARDRSLLLERLGMTEHEWACSGGEKFGDFETVSDNWEYKRQFGEKGEVVALFDEVDTSLPPPLPPGVPPLPPGVSTSPAPPLPPALPPLPPGVPPLPPEVYVAMGVAPPVLPPVLPPPVPPTPPGFLDSVRGPDEGMFSAPEPERAPDVAWTDEQRAALGAIDAWRGRRDEGFLAFTGPAGSGKTFTLREVCYRYPHATLAAMTGKAAHRMSQLTGKSATTLHRILYFPPKPGAETRFVTLRDPPSNLVLVDETSMCSPSVFEDLQAWTQDGVKVLLVGDSFQLPPVVSDKKEREQYGEDFSVFSEVKGPALTRVMRNAGGVLQAATHVRETGEVCTRSILDGHGAGYEFSREQKPVECAVEEYRADRDDHLLITWRNSTRMEANRAIRAKLGHGGPLPDVGEPVLVKKNGQGLLNGEIVECGGFEDGPKIDSLPTLWMILRGGDRVLVSVAGSREGEFFDGGTPWVENWSRYHIELRRGLWPEPLPITFGYCLTAHSAQGSEYRRVTVFLDTGDLRNPNFQKFSTLPSGKQIKMSARWLYTALTRSRSHSKLIVGK